MLWHVILVNLHLTVQTVCSHLKVVLSSAMLVHLTVPLQRVLGEDDEIQDRSAHSKLKKDLMEHIWNKNGICSNVPIV